MLSSKSEKRNQYANIIYISGFKFFARGRRVSLALSKPAFIPGVSHLPGLGTDPQVEWEISSSPEK